MASTMSYCAFQNASSLVADAVCKLNGMIEDEEMLSTLDIHEKCGGENLYNLCQEFIDRYEELEEMED